MINSFQSLNTITSGLILQQLQQEINASNISNPSMDANGYLMNSLQRVNSTTGAPLTIGNVNGLMQVGTGALPQTITRLRDSFLDTQIQMQSSILGQTEVLSNSQGTGILDRLRAIIDGPSTLDAALNKFAAAWGALGANANPATDGTDRATVVKTGQAFAQLATSQFDQLVNLQSTNGQQVRGTIAQINQLLQQLSAVNKQLLATGGSNQNSLLDARDYALDRLSRLVGIQTNFGVNGTANVYLANSSVTLLDPSGAAIFSTTPLNTHYPDLVGVTIQSPQGGFYGAGGTSNVGNPYDLAGSITGGNLGGELQAQYSILSYQRQLDQISVSVMDVTNTMNEAGYDATGGTNTPFFVGTGASDIHVSDIIANNNGYVAAALIPGTPTDGQVAKFLSNLPNILASNFVESYNTIASGGPVDRTLALGAGPPFQNFAASPVGPGQFTINGTTINWDTAPNVAGNPYTIDGILGAINAIPNVFAVYNATTGQFFIYSDQPIKINNITGNFTTWANIANVLTSSIRMNNYEAGTMPLIDASELPAPFGTPGADAMNSTLVGIATIPNPVPPPANFILYDGGPNSIAFKVVPSPTGIFTVNGNSFVWNNSMSLAGTNSIGAMINNPAATYLLGSTPYPSPNPNPYPNWTNTAQIAFTFDPTTQRITITSEQNGIFSPQPIQVADVSGNFTLFAGLNPNQTVGNLSSGILGGIATEEAGQRAMTDQAAASLQQLNNAQANIAGVSSSSDGSTPGVPVATLQQQAMQSLITYNAMLEVLQVIDQMYSDLVSMVGGASNTNFFQPRA